MPPTFEKGALDLFFFTGEHLRQPVEISYECKGGAVTSQTISATFHDEHVANLYFSDALRDLREELGQAGRDLDEPRIAEVQRDGVPEARRFNKWELGRRVVTLLLTQEAEGQWQVLISGP